MVCALLGSTAEQLHHGRLQAPEHIRRDSPSGPVIAMVNDGQRLSRAEIVDRDDLQQPQPGLKFARAKDFFHRHYRETIRRSSF